MMRVRENRKHPVCSAGQGWAMWPCSIKLSHKRAPIDFVHSAAQLCVHVVMFVGPFVFALTV